MLTRLELLHCSTMSPYLAHRIVEDNYDTMCGVATAIIMGSTQHSRTITEVWRSAFTAYAVCYPVGGMKNNTKWHDYPPVLRYNILTLLYLIVIAQDSKLMLPDLKATSDVDIS